MSVAEIPLHIPVKLVVEQRAATPEKVGGDTLPLHLSLDPRSWLTPITIAIIFMTTITHPATPTQLLLPPNKILHFDPLQAVTVTFLPAVGGIVQGGHQTGLPLEEGTLSQRLQNMLRSLFLPPPTQPPKIR